MISAINASLCARESFKNRRCYAIRTIDFSKKTFYYKLFRLQNSLTNLKNSIVQNNLVQNRCLH